MGEACPAWTCEVGAGRSARAGFPVVGFYSYSFCECVVRCFVHVKCLVGLSGAFCACWGAVGALEGGVWLCLRVKEAALGVARHAQRVWDGMERRSAIVFGRRRKWVRGGRGAVLSCGVLV